MYWAGRVLKRRSGEPFGGRDDAAKRLEAIVGKGKRET